MGSGADGDFHETTDERAARERRERVEYYTNPDGAGRVATPLALAGALVDAEIRSSKLETALKELVGFAERNSKRAEEAWKTANKELGHPNITKGTPEEFEVATAARWHEANRVLAVIRDRARQEGITFP